MIKLMESLPRTLYVACSGGVDSMAALDFLRRNHTVAVAYFDHASDNSVDTLKFVQEYCDSQRIPLAIGSITRDRIKSESLEEYWRNQRYEFLDGLGETVVTAHHLDDAVETWVFGSLNGQPKLPQLHRGNIVRPFLGTRKFDLHKWCITHNVPWIEDTSNEKLELTRNYIRKELIPHVLKVNPGIHKMIKKRLQDRQEHAI
jgi:tRNA(Ile)-lysidine synthase